jgi:putative transposase
LRGFDAGKKVKGVKRHIMVDTLGLVLDVMVTPANWQDRQGGLVLMGGNRGRWPRLRKVFADAGYAGQLVDGIRTLCGWELEIVKRSDLPGFHVSPKRWIVERTFAWLDKCRRLSKDYERLLHTSRSMVHLAMIRVMFRRLAR